MADRQRQNADSVEEGLIVLGSLNQKEADRTHAWSEIRPLQVVRRGRARPVSFFDGWGMGGISSMAWPASESAGCFICTGQELVWLDVLSGEKRTLPIPGLRDVHEITLIDDTLWLANTGFDEAVAVDWKSGALRERFRLDMVAFTTAVPDAAKEGAEPNVETVDHFHLNQVFSGLDGDLYGLVHHVSGKQFLQRVAQKLVKSHGGGGVLNLSRRERVPLSLRAPHSVRIVGEHYWIADSMRSMMNVYDAGWRLLRTIAIPGFGRGAALSADGRLLWIGISEVRKRYAGLLAGEMSVPNMVVAIPVGGGSEPRDVLLGDIEQVNNVYAVTSAQCEALAALDGVPGPTSRESGRR